jgi:hypothetical protein
VAARDAAARLQASGQFSGLATTFGYGDLQRLFSHA